MAESLESMEREESVNRGVVDQYNGGDHLAPNFLALASNVALGTGQKPRGRK